MSVEFENNFSILAENIFEQRKEKKTFLIVFSRRAGAIENRENPVIWAKQRGEVIGCLSTLLTLFPGKHCALSGIEDNFIGYCIPHISTPCTTSSRALSPFVGSKRNKMKKRVKIGIFIRE